MAFPREVISAVKERADIVEVIGERVHLASSGSDFLGLCPFHGEKTPSFRVSPAWRTYHCFGCEAGGSVIDFLMASDHLSFPEAVTALAERYGIPLPNSGAREEGGRSLEVLSAARDYFADLLCNRPEGEAARQYMTERNFDEADWRAFGLGFALDGWQGFTDHGGAMGFSREDLLASGLVREGKSGRPFDMLRKRVVFPIANERGRPIAFGGRVIDPLDEPKYINTPETRHYRKGRVLYGLSQGLPSLRESGRVLLVEGYLDVMRLHQHGFQEAVATCGTSLTEEHLKILERHVSKAVLLFDGDEAGIKAALRSAPLFLNQGVEARVCLLPGGMDPDDFLLREGNDAFGELLERAEPLLEFLVFQLLERNGRTVQGKEKALEALAPILSQVRKPAARDLTVRFIADLIGVRSDSVLATVKIAGEMAARKGRPGPKSSPAASGGHGNQGTHGNSSGTSQAALPTQSLALRAGRHQRRVLRLLLQERGLLARARSMLRPEEFTEPALRSLLERMLGFSDGEFVQVSVEELMEWYPDLAPVIRGLLVEEPVHLTAVTESADFGRQLESELFSIKEELKEQLFRKLRTLIGTPEEEGELSRYRELTREMSGMKRSLRKTSKPRPELTLRNRPAEGHAPPDSPVSGSLLTEATEATVSAPAPEPSDASKATETTETTEATDATDVTETSVAFEVTEDTTEDTTEDATEEMVV